MPEGGRASTGGGGVETANAATRRLVQCPVGAEGGLAEITIQETAARAVLLEELLIGSAHLRKHQVHTEMRTRRRMRVRVTTPLCGGNAYSGITDGDEPRIHVSSAGVLFTCAEVANGLQAIA